MAKIDLEQVQMTLLEQKIDPTKVAAIIKDLEKSIEEEKAERDANKVPLAKWNYTIIINDPDKKLGNELEGWIVKHLEGQDDGLILGKLTDAARNQNEASKKKKSLITGFGELFSAIKTKFLKEKGVKVCTKTSVRVLTVNGKTL